MELSLSIGLRLGIVIVLLGILPTYFLIRQYTRTGIVDYLIFSGFFIMGSFSQVGNVFGNLTDITIFYQITYMTWNLTFFLVFLHAVRYKWDSNNIPKYLLTMEFIIMLILSGMILFWKNFEQPDTAKLLFFEVSRNDKAFNYPNGAGLQTRNGTIIYSSDYDLLGVLHGLYSSILLLVIYLTVEPVSPTPRVLRARRLWILGWSFLVLFMIISLPWFDAGPVIRRIPLIFGLIIVIYISMKIPEGLIISYSQLIRAARLYEKIQSYDANINRPHIGLSSLIDYISNLPKELLQDIHPIEQTID